jgi:2-polyprenyl-6-methoxyphenol hydroxylase-like FAD-dependent oxidoreductase
LDWPSRSDLRADVLEQRYERASIMVGVLPLGQVAGGSVSQAAFFWSLRADRLDGWKTEGLAKWKAQVRRLWPATAPLLDQIDHPDRLTFARYAHRTLRRPAEPGLAHIGDAWHSASPQLGQGANMALLDGFALAKALRESGDLDVALDAYVGLRRGHVHLYQLLTDILTPVYQSDSRVIPALRDRIVGPLSKVWPIPAIQAGLVSGLVGFPLRRLGLA